MSDLFWLTDAQMARLAPFGSAPRDGVRAPTFGEVQG